MIDTIKHKRYACHGFEIQLYTLYTSVPSLHEGVQCKLFRGKEEGKFKRGGELIKEGGRGVVRKGKKKWDGTT